MDLLELFKFYILACIMSAVGLFFGKISTFFSCKLRMMGIQPRPTEIGPFSRGEFGAYLFDIFYFPLFFVLYICIEEKKFSRLFLFITFYVGIKISLFITRKIDGY